jgi:hypothetical protein
MQNRAATATTALQQSTLLLPHHSVHDRRSMRPLTAQEFTGACGAAANMVQGPPPQWGVCASSLARDNLAEEVAACV